METRRGGIRTHGYRELTPRILQVHKMHLGKYHGLGNDFLVALSADNPHLEADPAVARSLCDRHTGVGADGLIYALEPLDPANDAQMVLLNSDGSRAEISGNGIRCMAQALLAHAIRATPGSAPADSLAIETDGGLRCVELDAGDPSATMSLTVEMGEPRSGPPVSAAASDFGASHVATVDIGNPHLVLCVTDPEAVELSVEGPRLEADYPAGINVHFVSVDQAGEIDLRVWERGAGITLACGSGAVAAAVAAHGWGLVERSVKVRMPGGIARVGIADGSVRLTGPSTFVATVTVP